MSYSEQPSDGVGFEGNRGEGRIRFRLCSGWVGCTKQWRGSWAYFAAHAERLFTRKPCKDFQADLGRLLSAQQPVVPKALAMATVRTTMHVL